MASSSSSASGSPYQSLTKWLSLKIYQVEVTFSVYIFTPLEKFIFCTSILLAHSPHPLYIHTNPLPKLSTTSVLTAAPPSISMFPPLLTHLKKKGSVVFLLFSLTAIATILYLPHHIMFLAGRAWFYIHGDSAVEAAGETARSLAAAAAAAAAATTPTAKAIATETARAVVGEVVGKAEL